MIVAFICPKMKRNDFQQEKIVTVPLGRKIKYSMLYISKTSWLLFFVFCLLNYWFDVFKMNRSVVDGEKYNCKIVILSSQIKLRNIYFLSKVINMVIILSAIMKIFFFRFSMIRFPKYPIVFRCGSFPHLSTYGKIFSISEINFILIILKDWMKLSCYGMKTLQFLSLHEM